MSGIYSIADLRRLAPPELRNASDDRLIHEYSKDVGMDPRDVAKYLGTRTGDDHGVLRSGLSSGLDQLQGLGYSALGGVADAVGFDRGRDWANERADFNQTQGYLTGKPELERVEDQTLGSAPAFAGYQIAKQVPMIAGVLGAQFIPGVGQASSALGLTRLGAMAPRVMGGGGYTAGAGHAAGRAALAQGETFGTSMLAGTGIGYGALYQESVDGGDPSPYLSMLGAPAYGAAEALVPAAVRGALRAPGQFSGNLLTRMGKAGGLAALGEAGTELTQNELEMQMYGYDQLAPEERQSRRLNSAVIGGLVGGSLGTMGGIRGPQQTVDEGEFDMIAPPPPRQLGLVRPASDVPLQNQIDQRLGIGGNPAAREGYEKSFNEAFNEPSGEFTVDPQTGQERELTVGEVYQRDAGVLGNDAQPNPEVQKLLLRQTELFSKLDEKAGLTTDEIIEFKSIAEQLQTLKDAGISVDQQAGTPPAPSKPSLLSERDKFLASREIHIPKQDTARNKTLSMLFDEAVDSGIPLDSPLLEDYWHKIGEGTYTGKNQLAEMARLLQHAMAENAAVQRQAPTGINSASAEAQTQAAVAQPGDFHVSGTGVAADAATRSSGQPSPVVDRGVGDSGPDAAVGVARSGPAEVAGAPAGPADAVADTGGAPATPVKPAVRRAGETKSSVVQPRSELTEQEDNELEIARLTGSQSLADALEAGAVGQRVDAVDTVLTPEQREDVLDRRFAKDKDPERAKQIFEGYVDAVKNAPRGFVGESHAAVGKDFGVGKHRVEQIANVEALIRAGEAAGFTPEQIENTFGVTRRGSSTRSDGSGPVEGEVEVRDQEAYAALRSAGLEFEEGDTSGFGGLDNSRQWQKESSAGNPEGDRLIRHAEHIERLRESVKTLQAKGLNNAASTVAKMIEGEQQKADALRASLEKKATPAVPKRDLSPELVAAKKKFKDLKNDLSKMDRAELELLRGEAVFFKNKAKLAEIDAALGREPEPEPEPEVKAEPKPKIAGTKPKAAKKAEVEVAKKAEAEVDTLGPYPSQVAPSVEGKKAWDDAVKLAPDLPSWNELMPVEQEQFLGDGNFDLHGVVNFAEARQQQLDDQRKRRGTKLGKGNSGPKAKNPYTAKELLAELKRFMRADIPGRKLMVVDTVGDLLQHPDGKVRAVGAAIGLEGAYGVASDGRAFLVADRIEKGAGRAKFMHEVGSHLGLDQLLPPAIHKRLVGQIKKWASSDADTNEVTLAARAQKRVWEAGSPAADQDSELLAYFIEEAVEAGVDPTAEAMQASKPLQQWFRTLWAAFKSALQKLGVMPAKLTAQDIVDLAFGAASLELTNVRAGTTGQRMMFGKESHAARPGANVVRLAKLLGPKLYGSPADLVRVSVKEILQNSFDAIKGKIAQTGDPDSDWRIDIDLSEADRTIKFKDNGTGMSPEVLGGQFLQIAGTNKESDNASGGLGIAKMLFLYGNESLDVITMRNGKIARLSTSGEQLMQSLDGASEPPNVDVYTPQDAPELATMFPDGHGTVITVKVPKTYTDAATNQVRDISFPTSSWDFPVLENSPLFAPIQVRVNGWAVDVGSDFPAHKYTTFADVEFEWGTARIYVSKEPYKGYGSNTHVLSNGLWQFSKDIKTNPMDLWGGKVPRKFYLDVNSKVRPEDAGYPFDLSRQKFSESADSDMDKIFNYISALYRAEDIGNDAKDFGVTQYLTRGRDGKVTATPEEKLMPEIPQTGVLAAIKEGDSVEVKDGRLIVNGREVPQLTREDLGKSSIDIDSLRIDQSSIDPKKVMIHDNLLVAGDFKDELDEARKAYTDQGKLVNELHEAYNKLHDDYYADRGVTSAQLEAAWQQYLAADNEQGRLGEVLTKLREKASADRPLQPITEAGREKFGQRFDNYVLGVGELFQTLRNKLVEVMGPEYAPLADEAIGVSFDQEYRGVSVKLPFAGMFINPAVPEYTDPVRAAYGMFGTMVHELAHFRVRSHNADFASEMQRIAINLEASDLDIAKIKRDFVEHVRTHQEVLNWLHGQNTDNSSKPRGRRFKDGDQQSRLPGNAGNVAGPGQAARSAQRVPGRSQAGAGGGPQGGQRAAGNAPNQGAAAAVRPPPSRSVVERNVAKLPKPAQQPVRNTVLGANDFLRKGLDTLVFTHTLIDRAAKAGMKSAQTFYRLLAERSHKVRENERRVEKISDMYAEIEAKDKGDGPRGLNRFLFESTRQGKWGYGKDRDAEMGDWFDELGPKSQAMVKAIFEHGDTVLAEKKQTILDYTNSEYDGLIAAAQIAGNAELVKELQQDKANSLKKYQTLFKVHEGKPYAPIKRMGNHVVLAKSAEYREAEANNDKATLRKLELDPDHYHVSFTDSKNEARRLADRLLEQGHFGTEAEAVTFFERSAENEDVFRSSTLQGLTALRSRVDDRAGKGRSELQRMVNDMWLNTLAESSARKSEMRRRGISGEVDMLRSFASQGQADAQFIASVEYSERIQDSLRDMDKEVKNGGDRDRKSQLRNEIVRRYNQSLELSPSPLVNKITRMSSIYFLASSPMYYLQNATQPWMMSLPAITANHDYTKASKALLKAYGELGPMVKAFKWSSQFDFTKVPPDVFAAVQELVHRGRIDIGLDTELGEFRIEGSGKFAAGWNKLDKVLRLMVQKGEAINRLSTGIAAYRLELARTNNHAAALDYADRILLDTHGDYGRFNAPRPFNTNIGKVALQFRKFQLIQMTFYAKMFKDAFAGSSPGEKAAARKVLAFSLGHLGLAAGAMGLPGYHAVAYVLGTVLGSDDEPYDLTFELRKLIGNEDLANVIMRGAPTIVGADISQRVGAGTMLSVMPFSTADMSTPQGVAQAAGTLVGGASLGMGMRMMDGLGLMLSGDWMRGAELVLPKGLGDAIKGARFGADGMTRRNGDVLLSADEISMAETFMTAIGMSPVQTSVTYERRNRQFETDKNFQDRSTRVRNQYTKAYRNRDTEGMREARDAWQKLQEARVRNGYTRQPMSSLLKAPQEQAKRERGTVAGVQTNRSNAGFAELQTSI